MTRVKRSVHARKKRRSTLALTKGFRGDASRHYRVAKEALLKADQYRYRDRRNRKRDFRRLWIARLQRRRPPERHVLLPVHARPAARRSRARPKDPRGHRRARRQDLPTLCRPRPRGAGGRLTPKPTTPAPPPGRRSFRTAPFLMITSPTTTSSKRSASFASGVARASVPDSSWREGEDLLVSADASGWVAIERYVAAGSGLEGVEVEPALFGFGIGAQFRDAGARGVRGAVGAGAGRTAVRVPSRRPRSGQRRRR